jgi:hypothetical protein
MCECKVCGIAKVRQEGGKRSGCSGTYKVDGAGRRWNGLTCPDCRSDQVGVRRGESRSDFGPTTPLYPAKQRRCPSCGDMSANYFKCPPCTSHAMEQGCLAEEMYGEIVMDSKSGTFAKGAGFRY